ncbi:MAG: hypothetical protein PHU21_08405 [Elusimicrobia bacterium]|nr:hypothetical protein [Elusimicrobiota bacterium]
MNQWDEEALREINSLEAARLAIRGALATIRDMQDLNARAKAETRDEAAKRKLAEAKAAELVEQVEQWRRQGEAWEKEREERDQNEARWREAARLEVRAEERTRIEEGRALMEAELARLQAELQQMAGSYQRRCESQAAALESFKKTLERREVELLAARRRSEELSRSLELDAQTIESQRRHIRRLEEAAGPGPGAPSS